MHGDDMREVMYRCICSDGKAKNKDTNRKDGGSVRRGKETVTGMILKFLKT